MKTTNLTQNSSSTNWSLSQEDQPRPAGEQAATSASASEQRLARQPAKRPRVEQDEPGMAPQRREPLSVNLHNAAGSSGERSRVPESRTDRVPAYASTSSRRMPHQPTSGLEQTTKDTGLAEQGARRGSKRMREGQEPSRPLQRPRHAQGLTRALELNVEDLRRVEQNLSPAAQQRLRQERELQRQQLNDLRRRAQPHNADLCLPMAQRRRTGASHRLQVGPALPGCARRGER